MNLAGQGTYFERQKGYLSSYTLPSIDRATDGTHGVIVLPIFQAWSNIIPEYHLNSAFWVYHSFLVNSDIIERGVPIIFYVEKSCWNYEHVRKMFREAHIPADSIWIFDGMPSNLANFYLGLKMSPLWDARFDKFENVLIWDVDLFVASPSGADLFKTDQLFQREKRTQPAALHVRPDQRKPFRLYETHRLEDDRAKRQQDAIMMALCGQVYEEGGFSIGGCVHSFCPGEIREDYIDFYREALPLIGDDEMIVSLWSVHTNQEIECLDALYPAMAYETGHIYQFQENAHNFLCHLWLDSVEKPADIDVWRDVIGYNKRNNIYPLVDFNDNEVSRTHIDPLIPLNVDLAVDNYEIQPLVAYLNLERRTDRRDNFERTLRAKGYEGEIHRIEATDMQAFDNYEDFIAYAMGRYPSFEQMRCWNSRYLAYQYSYMNCLYWILSQDKPVLLFEDDMTIKEDWDTTLKRINLLPSDFTLAMLNYNHAPARQKQLPYFGNGWEIGAKSNGTSCNLYTPKGAQLLYDSLVSDPTDTGECRLEMIVTDGIYSASPVIACTLPNSGKSDATPHHSLDNQ